jgi:hypothetical protein
MADCSTLAAATSIFCSLIKTPSVGSPARRRRRREAQPRPYQLPLPYTRFNFNIDLWEDAWVKKRMRSTKEEIALILPYLGLDGINWKTDKNRFKPSETKAFAVTLCRFAFSLRLFD